MHYEISTDEFSVTATFEGTLKAVDLIFMNQDPRYRESLATRKNLILDFSQVSGSHLTKQDTMGLAMLGKIDSEKVKNICLYIVVAKGEAGAMQTVCEKIFADSSWQLTVVESTAELKRLLNSNVKID